MKKITKEELYNRLLKIVKEKNPQTEIGQEAQRRITSTMFADLLPQVDSFGLIDEYMITMGVSAWNENTIAASVQCATECVTKFLEKHDSTSLCTILRPVMDFLKESSVDSLTKSYIMADAIMLKLHSIMEEKDTGELFLSSVASKSDYDDKAKSAVNAKLLAQGVSRAFLYTCDSQEYEDGTTLMICGWKNDT